MGSYNYIRSTSKAMKKILLSIIAAIILSSCAHSGQYSKSKAYQMDNKYKASLNYHRNEANKVVDENKKNRSTNLKHANKKREDDQKALERLNSNTKSAKYVKKHSGVFNFY
jgi:outer membrane lipoprotein-sorting protein